MSIGTAQWPAATAKPKFSLENGLKYEYRATLTDKSGRIQNVREAIDTCTWLERITTNTQRYGNAGELINQYLLPHANDEDIVNFYRLYFEMYEGWRQSNNVLVFEFAMYMWSQFKEGRISNKVWAAVIALAWQSGERGMMSCVVLTVAEVREMFKAADQGLLRVFGSDEETTTLFDGLPETFTVYRGVSTGIAHFEDGLSWTLDPDIEPERFAALNCHSKNEIPGFITAVIRKEAVLAVFWFERELVVDPEVPKVSVQKRFLRGNELRKFHKRLDAQRNEHPLLAG